MVVMPHGGPHTRDTMAFNPLAQIMALRGYVVFQMNFRGSSGYGTAFERAGYGEWGGLMQSDITDGIDAMIEQSVADPDRMCMVGFSYGAYASMLEGMSSAEILSGVIVTLTVSSGSRSSGCRSENESDTEPD